MDLLCRIKKLCKENNVSQRKLEQTLGFGNGAITKWKTSTPSVDSLQKVADFFGVSLAYLRTGDQEKEQPSDTSPAINDDVLKAAFYAGYSDKLSPTEVDELWEDAKEYAQFKAQQRINKKD